MKHWRIWLLCAALLVPAACRGGTPHPITGAATRPPASVAADQDDSPDVPTIVIAPAVQGSVDESMIRDVFQRVVAQGERDFGLLPAHRITLYIDPDNASGLEDALGISQKYAIHLRAGHTRNVSSLLPLMMHEYTHSLQYQIGRLRPQWWIEGQADHEALRVREPGAAERERRTLYGRLASDVKAGRAPDLSALRGSIAWDDYIKKAGAGKAYGWGNAAVAFIEARASFAGVKRVMTSADGPNTLSSFDAAVQQVTGLAPADFDAALKRWVVDQAKG